ncbi:ribosome-recycling factor, partial [Metamycoplasma hyosynoviae]
MELQIYLEELKELAMKIIDNYQMQITKVAIGRANPALISKIKVNYYDSILAIDELSSIQVASALQLIVKPFDLGSIKIIEKAITEYNLGVSISNEGHQLRISYPQLTTEKRHELVKKLNVYTEQAKVNIRQARQEINKKIKSNEELSEDLKKHFLDSIQKEIENYIVKIEKIANEKESDLLT